MERKDGWTSNHVTFSFSLHIVLYFRLTELGRRLDKAERSSLLAIAEHLKRLNQASFAAEIYRRVGDSAAVLSLHVEAKEWSQAFSLVQTQPQYKSLVYVPYAHWLAENDKFVQAQKG
jgi:intraflagellar transport protein 122